MARALVTCDNKVLAFVSQSPQALSPERNHTSSKEAFLGSFVEALNGLKKP